MVLRDRVGDRLLQKLVDSAGRVERVDGIWTVMEQTMRSLRDETHTVFTVLEAENTRVVWVRAELKGEGE